MIIDVSSVLKEYGKKIILDDDIDLEDTPFLGEIYHFTHPVHIKGSIANNGKALELKAKCSCGFTARCARCTKEIEVCEEFDVDEILSRDEDNNSEESDVIVFDGMEIDLDDIVLNSFLMNIEGRYLCSEDCKGLCPNCGADLNEGDCGCSDEAVSPGWEGLLDIIKANE